MQLFGGDGNLISGPVFAIQKSPLAMVAGMITGSGKVDLAVVAARSPTLQVFANVFAPGYRLNGTACVLGADCLSSRCIDGVCCAEQCAPTERCDIAGREGGCSPVFPEPVACTLPEQPECAADQFCVDGYCCDQPCVGGHCNVSGFLGVCIIGVPDGQPCSGNDAECSSGFCSRRNLVCCREPCEEGFCDSDGICQSPVPNGAPCEEDAECESFCCDEFDLICCNRRCPPFDAMLRRRLRGTDLTPIASTATIPTPHLRRAPETLPPVADKATAPPTSSASMASASRARSVRRPTLQRRSRQLHRHSDSVRDCHADTNSPADPADARPVRGLPAQRPCNNGLCYRLPTTDNSGCSAGSGDPVRGTMSALLLPIALWIARRRHCAGHRGS